MTYFIRVSRYGYRGQKRKIRVYVGYNDIKFANVKEARKHAMALINNGVCEGLSPYITQAFRPNKSVEELIGNSVKGLMIFDNFRRDSMGDEVGIGGVVKYRNTMYYVNNDEVHRCYILLSDGSLGTEVTLRARPKKNEAMPFGL